MFCAPMNSTFCKQEARYNFRVQSILKRLQIQKDTWISLYRLVQIRRVLWTRHKFVLMIDFKLFFVPKDNSITSILEWAIDLIKDTWSWLLDTSTLI